MSVGHVIPGFDPVVEESFPGPPPSPPRVALYVPHFRHPKMCGRVVERAPGIFVIYHESNGTQHHHKLHCLGGVDAAVLHWMQRYGIEEFHHEITALRVDPVGLYAASRALIRDHGQLRTWDGRDRYFLPTVRWRFQPVRDYAVPTQLPALALAEPVV
jgi:hypothetical protein